MPIALDGALTVRHAPTTKHPNAEGVIQACFDESPYPALRGIRCSVQDDVAQLDGALPSFYLKQLAQEIVKQLNAVEQVANRIQVVAAH